MLLPSAPLLRLRGAHPHKQGCLGWLGPQDMTPSWMELSRAPEKGLGKKAPSMMAVRPDPVPLPGQEMGLPCCVWPGVSEVSTPQRPPEFLMTSAAFLCGHRPLLSTARHHWREAELPEPQPWHGLPSTGVQACGGGVVEGAGAEETAGTLHPGLSDTIPFLSVTSLCRACLEGPSSVPTVFV